MKSGRVERIVNSILTRKYHEKLGHKHDEGLKMAHRGFLPKPPPPRLRSKRTSHAQKTKITVQDEEVGDWEGPLNWDSPIEWHPELNPIEKDPPQGETDQFQTDDPDILEESQAQEEQ